MFLTCGLCVCLSAAWICCNRNSVWLWRIACSSSTCCVITFRRSGCSWVSRDRTCTRTWCKCVHYFRNCLGTFPRCLNYRPNTATRTFYITITTRFLHTRKLSTQFKVNNKMCSKNKSLHLPYCLLSFFTTYFSFCSSLLV